MQKLMPIYPVDLFSFEQTQHMVDAMPFLGSRKPFNLVKEFVNFVHDFYFLFPTRF